MSDTPTLVPTKCRQRGDDLCSNPSGGVDHCGYDPVNRATLGFCREVRVRNFVTYVADLTIRNQIRGDQRPDSDDAR